MEETTKFRKFWKNNYKLVFLFFIRLTEVFVSSIIPSFLGVVLIFLNPNKRIWTIINFVTLIAFGFINFRFLLKYIAGRNNKKEYYILNSIVYLIYVAASLVMYKSGGYLVYSMIFANMRGLEAFGMKTFHSILICDAITLISMFILGKYAYKHIKFVRKIMRMNGADAIEMVYEDSVPTQNSEEIKTLSVEEMEKEIERDMQEAVEVVRRKLEESQDDPEHTKAFKGNNEEIQFVTPENPDNDIDETDHVEENAETLNKNSAYDSDSLWEKSIYRDGEPITSYDDEYEPVPETEDITSAGDRIKVGMQQVGDTIKGVMRHHIRSATRIAVVKRKNRLGDEGFDEAEYDERTESRPVTDLEDYDSDSLWSNDLYQGKRK